MHFKKVLLIVGFAFWLSQSFVFAEQAKFNANTLIQNLEGKDLVYAHGITGDDDEMVRLVVKCLYQDELVNQNLIDIAALRLLYKTDAQSKLEIDAQAWIVRLVGKYGNAERKSMLEKKLNQNKLNNKIKTHIVKALKQIKLTSQSWKSVSDFSIENMNQLITKK